MSKNQKRTVFTILMIIIINVATKLLGFVRDAYIGQVFAQLPSLDTYFVSLNLTSLTYLSLGSAIVIATIPLIINTRNNENRDKILSGVLTYILSFAILGVLFYSCFSGLIVDLFASGFDAELKAVTSSNIRTLSVTLILVCITYFNIALLQSNEKYKVAAMISIPYNLITIFAVFIFGTSKGISSLVYATALGWVFQMLMTVPQMLKVSEFKFRPNFKNTDGMVFSTLLGLIPIILVYMTTQANVTIANSFLTKFEGGSVTAYYYAQMMFVAIVTIIVYAISAVMFPKFSIAINENKQEFFNALSQVVQSVVVLMLPITICLLLFSQPIVEIIFLRGSFTIETAQETANLLKIISLYMIAYGFLDILNRGYFTLNDKKTPIFSAITIIGTNFLLDYIFINVLHFGFYFVALSTVIAYFIGVSASAILFSKKYGNLGVRNILKSFSKGFIGAIAMIVVYAIMHITFGARVSGINDICKFLVMAIEGLSVVATYLVALILLKEKNSYEFIQRLINKKIKNK